MKTMFFRVLCLMVLALATVSADVDEIGIFESSHDVGNPKLKGTVSYDAGNKTYTLTGAGKNIWDNSDEFFFVWTKVTGDFSLSAALKFSGAGMNAHRKMGVMIRESLDGNSPYADVAVHGDGLTSLQYRATAGAETKEVAGPPDGDYITIERTGNKIVMRSAIGHLPQDITGTVELKLPQTCYVGIFVCSHEENVIEQAVFSKVELKLPSPARSDVTSVLEILDLTNGNRKVVKEFPYVIEAPNWTPDGRFLIYNSGGKLYRISPSLPDDEPALINTGYATNCNNDHQLTRDGRTLAISHGTKEDRKSRVYTVPVGGGTPRLITPLAPSYLHGWSPDSKYLAYCAERNGNFDVYVIPAEGGEEVRLTTAEGLDDGPEYSPDGHIWFNSVRSGLMQIWRMKADGTEQTQMTFDEDRNSWFPHISPDGKQVIYITYNKGDLRPDQHLANKNVELRLMPAEGGEPITVAKLFGGQGTINVNSWAPDNKRIAFVSYKVK